MTKRYVFLMLLGIVAIGLLTQMQELSTPKNDTVGKVDNANNEKLVCKEPEDKPKETQKQPEEPKKEEQKPKETKCKDCSVSEEEGQRLRSLLVNPKDSFAFVVRGGDSSNTVEPFSRYLISGPWPLVVLKGTSAEGYVIECLQMSYDWVINTDQDVFVSNITYIFQLMRNMDLDNQDVLCHPDGGYTPRMWVPNVCNPFFNIFRLKSIRKKMSVTTEALRAGIVPNEQSKRMFEDKYGSIHIWETKIERPDPKCLIPSTWNSQNHWTHFEPFTEVFLYLRYNSVYRWACSRIIAVVNGKPTVLQDKTDVPGEEFTGTVLLTEEDLTPYMYHSWYARSGLNARLEYLRDLAYKQRGLPIPPSKFAGGPLHLIPPF